MNKPPIVQLETQIERLVEGAFTGIFRRRLQAQDVALQLARSLEDNLRASQSSDPRPLAPDEYTISLHPQTQHEWQQARPELNQVLGQHLLELATQLGYQMPAPPLVRLIAGEKIPPGKCVVVARHSGARQNTTAAMQPIPQHNTQATPYNPQLVVNGTRSIQLTQALINIGRGVDNDIVIDDPFISRHHLQLRLRFGAYTLFDVQSRGGTRVNGILVNEHSLHSGDVVQLGNTSLLYLADDQPKTNPPGTTTSLDAVDGQQGS